MSDESRDCFRHELWAVEVRSALLGYLPSVRLASEQCWGRHPQVQRQCTCQAVWWSSRDLNGTSADMPKSLHGDLCTSCQSVSETSIRLRSDLADLKASARWTVGLLTGPACIETQDLHAVAARRLWPCKAWAGCCLRPPSPASSGWSSRWRLGLRTACAAGPL